MLQAPLGHGHRAGAAEGWGPHGDPFCRGPPMSHATRPSPRRIAAIAVVTIALTPAVAPTLSSPAVADPPDTKRTTVEVYDSFQAPGGYTLADYAAKWSNPYGPGEMANADTRSFGDNTFHVSAVPFTTG